MASSSMMATNEEKRSELAAKLEKEIDEYVSQLKPKKYEEGWPEDKWEEEMEKHPIFMTKAFGEGGELPPLVEAMQQLKYDPDENTPEELALSYKEDGNQNFKVKKYRWAVESFTEGLKCGCKDNDLNAQLYSNRAAAHFYIGNYKKALTDATEAKALKPDYIKAIQRGALCSLQLELFAECVAWCDQGLKVEPNNSQFKEMKDKAIKAKKMSDRNKRKAEMSEAKKKKEKTALLKYFQDEGINFDKSSVDLETLEAELPVTRGYGVHFDEKGCVVWPVMLLYPEHEIVDTILHFEEDSTFRDQLSVMFDSGEFLPWDEEKKYKLQALQIYFERLQGAGIVKVPMDSTLKTVVRDNRFFIRGGLPAFFITVKKSKFDATFREKKRITSS